MLDTTLYHCIDLVSKKMKSSQRILFLTGAGMSADSDLPTFRDEEGLWRAFPLFKNLGINPEILATPYFFDNQPELAWGFDEWMRRMASEKRPHPGYFIINQWMKEREGFVQTTNVDGYHLRSGCPEDRIHEAHGSLWRLQCSRRKCERKVTVNPEVPFLDLDRTTMKVFNLPKCELCGNILRPNVLLFGDWDYRTNDRQYENLVFFLQKTIDIVFLIGSSASIPTNDQLAFICGKTYGSMIVTINPDPSCKEYVQPDIYLSLAAKEALIEIDRSLR